MVGQMWLQDFLQSKNFTFLLYLGKKREIKNQIFESHRLLKNSLNKNMVPAETMHR